MGLFNKKRKLALEQIQIKFGKDAFAAGLAQQMFRDIKIEEIREYSATLRSNELQEMISQKFPTLSNKLKALAPAAEENGSLRMLIFFIKGAKSEDPLEIELMEKHILNWNSPKKMYAEIELLCGRLKEKISADEEIDALLKLSSENDTLALRFVHASLVSAVRSIGVFEPEEIKEGLATAVKVLNGW